jgi:hypothetical protein
MFEFNVVEYNDVPELISVAAIDAGEEISDIPSEMKERFLECGISQLAYLAHTITEVMASADRTERKIIRENEFNRPQMEKVFAAWLAEEERKTYADALSANKKLLNRTIWELNAAMYKQAAVDALAVAL